MRRFGRQRQDKAITERQLRYRNTNTSCFYLNKKQNIKLVEFDFSIFIMTNQLAGNVMIESIKESLEFLRQLNPRHAENNIKSPQRRHKLQKVLIANRGEIAKRFFLALKEEKIPSVAIVTDADLGQSWYQQADEVIVIGSIRNYTNIPVVIAAALMVEANAIYPGYGFLSENPKFVEQIELAAQNYKKEIIFMGPSSQVMHKVGDKLAARHLAAEQGVPLFEGSEVLLNTEEALRAAEKIGYPLIVKLSAGGGGKGMMPVSHTSDLPSAVEYCQRIGKSLYNDVRFYLEKYIQQPVHMEVQIFNGTSIGIRKCAVQRKNQKVLEEAGEFFLDSHMSLALLSAAENMARIAGYNQGAGAGTVEFLYDAHARRFGFLEMNTRLQVEHPVTDQSLGIDLATWQILLFDQREYEIPFDRALEGRFRHKQHSLEARIYAEDPENEYAPSPGKILELELPTFIGLRCDFGFKKGDVILPHYDPLIGKIIAFGDTREEAISRLKRSLGELYIQGVVTNINQLLQVIRHPQFLSGEYNNLLLSLDTQLEHPQPSAQLRQRAAIFAALCENARRNGETIRFVFSSRDLANTVESMSLNVLPNIYTVKVYGSTYRIELVQITLESFFVFINSEYAGEVELVERAEGDNDYLIRFGLQSYPLRIDHRPHWSILRLPDNEGETHYLKVNILASESFDQQDPVGMVRAPFQASFVNFATESDTLGSKIFLGAHVQKGDPVVVVSAMKMESALKAPVSGKISFLMEGGELSRLQIGKTADGLVIGKSINEGEVLFIVEPFEKKDFAQEQETISKEEITVGSSAAYILNTFFQDDIAQRIEENLREHIAIIFKIIHSHFLGFPVDSILLEKISSFLTSISAQAWQQCGAEFVQNEISSITRFYANIKQIYSPALNGNLTFFGELNMFVEHWHEEDYQPSYDFRLAMNALFKAYGVVDWQPIPLGEKERVQKSFFFILRAYSSVMSSAHIIRNFVKILSQFSVLNQRSVNTLKKLIAVEQSERDDSLAEQAIRALRRTNSARVLSEPAPLVSRKHSLEFRLFIDNIFSTFPDGVILSREKFVHSLQNPLLNLLEKNLQPWLQKKLQKIIDYFTASTQGKVERLYSPYQEIFIYRVTRENKNPYYLCAGACDEARFERDENQNIISSENVELLCINSARVVRIYHNLAPLNNNRVEIFVAGKQAMKMDLVGDSPVNLNYTTLRKIGLNIFRFFTNLSINDTMIHLNTTGKYFSGTKFISMSRKGSKLSIDFLSPRDPTYPYFQETLSPAEERLFAKHKWPVRLWADESFDKNEYSEIIINSIDKTFWLNPKSEKEEIKKVGGKIFIGKMQEQQVLFYMKDSRISGGASGNLEGLKYIAAAYLAYLKDIPLYVWNDGAGANVREGMIALNRAGQGFQMNSLLAARVSAHEFYERTKHNCDSRLVSLFDELDKQFALQNVPSARRPRHCFVAAVGVGSSSGLDVYGSSQAAIQVILDAPESYRVLTGSNVIKSVTSEDMSNYEIGGAKVMERWTGTVDMVAADKLHLLALLQQVQFVFKNQQTLPSIARQEIKKSARAADKESEVLSEDIVAANVDNAFFLPFKSEWYGSGNLIGGFARLGGFLVLIMGPRSHMGIRSFQAIIRAKELLATAHKTAAHQIFVFGRKWYHETVMEDALSFRARIDFIKDVQKKEGVRIHIVCHIGGLHKVTLNTLADAIIFVRYPQLTSKEEEIVSQIAAFVVDSLPQAFDLSQRLLGYLSHGHYPVEVSEQKARLPNDSALSFDMLQDIIEPTFDKGSFLELFAAMNHPLSGPSLITGFARLNGEAVAVIADQPKIMGGAPDAPGTEKFRIFSELAERNQMPIIMLSNAPGFVPGAKQERLRIQQIGAESLDVNILGTTPVVSVVLNQNFGGRQIHAFSKYLRPGIVYLALKNSVMAVMGATASFDLFSGSRYKQLLEEGKDDEAARLRKAYMEDYNRKAAAQNDAYASGILDWLIADITQLRENLLRGLQEAKRRIDSSSAD